MRYFITIFLFTISLSTLCQNVRVTVNSESIPFYLFCNEAEVNVLPVIAVTLTELQPGKNTLRARFAEGVDLIATRQIQLKPNTHTTFELAIVNGVAVMVPVIEIEITPTGQIASGEEIPIAESVSTDCAMTSGFEGFDQVLSELKSIEFEKSRLEYMKSFIATHQLNSTQVVTLLSHLEMEANKLEFFLAVFHSVTDKHQLNSAIDLFHLERNKQKIRSATGL